MANASDFSETKDPKLSWAEQHETAEAIEQFSVGLWRVFIGSLLLFAAVAAIYLPLLVGFFDVAMLQLFLDPRLQVPIMIGSIAGAWIYFSGKQHCLSFSLPVQKRYLLTASLGCDIGAFLCRFVRDVPMIGPPSRIAASIMVLVGFLLLLGFYAYLAKLIGARSSYLMGVATGAMTLAGVIGVFLAGVAATLLPPDWFWLPFTTLTLLLMLTIATYLILTATLSFQLKQFSQFLKQSLETEMAEAYEYED